MFSIIRNRIVVHLIFCLIIIRKTSCQIPKCNRTPDGHGAVKTPADGRFHIRISESTAKYTPGRTYTITLEGIDAGIRQMPVPLRHKFSGFFLAVEKKSNDTQDTAASSIGVFSILQGETLTKIVCPNVVTHTTTTPKSTIQILWTAPQQGSGCVTFKATVIEHRDVWYMDDGPLSKDFCEDEQNFDDTITSQIDPCCACSEAKYELTFEGLWSRNTHPRDFPSNNWLTRFSDIIGASHTVDYRFWQYGEAASDGLQQVAEHGATRLLETELKGQSEHIRTIIKARGLAYPNVTGKTFAVFRVDKKHHLMSFVSMIDPSPDWFVGVSGLELCLPNCSWIENKVLDMYPWDAGTDAGPTYISPDQPLNPKDHIRKIKPDYPNDPRSPFYDPSSMGMKPLARLYLFRQRLYERENCPDSTENDAILERQACATTPWGKWGKCSAPCGKGSKYRQRVYVDQDQANKMECKKDLTQREECIGTQSNCESNNSEEVEEVTDPACALTDWSEWSECEPNCGSGTQKKTRKYVNKKARKRCQGGDNKPLLEVTQECQNAPCVGEITPSEEDEQAEDEECELSDWGPWEPCSVPCGGGTKRRYKKPVEGSKCGEESIQEDTKSCNNQPCKIPEFCYEDPVTGSCRNVTNMWFFNRNYSRCDVFTWSCGDHENKFTSNEDCIQTCTGLTSQYKPRQQNGRKKPRTRNGVFQY